MKHLMMMMQLNQPCFNDDIIESGLKTSYNDDMIEVSCDNDVIGFDKETTCKVITSLNMEAHPLRAQHH